MASRCTVDMMESDTEFGSWEGILSEQQALRIDLVSEPEAKRLLCYYALGDANRSFDPDVNFDRLLKFCGGVPTILIIAGHELRRRGNTASACSEILIEMKGEDLPEYIVETVYWQLREPSREAFLNIAYLFNGWERSRIAQIVGEMELRDLEGAALVTTSEDGKVIMHDTVRAVRRILRIPLTHPLCIVLMEQHIPMDEGLINVSDPEGLLHMNEGLINPSDPDLFTVDEGLNIFTGELRGWNVLKLLYVINLKESSLRIVVICGVPKFSRTVWCSSKTTLVTLTAVFSLDCRNCMKDRILRYPLEKDLVETDYYFLALLYIQNAMWKLMHIMMFIKDFEMPALMNLNNERLFFLPLRSKILVTTRNLRQTDILGHQDGIQVRSHTVDLSKSGLLGAYETGASLWSHYTFSTLRLVQICKGIPCILKIVGYELRRRRNSVSACIEIRKEIQDLTKTEGGADPAQLMVDIVYRKLEEPSQNAFLDIAFYFYGWERSKVAGIVGEMELRKLEGAGLVTISEAGRVRMCDIVKARGRQLDQGSRIRDWESLRLVLSKPKKLKNIQGIWLDGGEYVGVLKCKHIDLMSKSLRVLYLGASITGRWKRAFKELRFLHISYKNLFTMPPPKRLRKSVLLRFVVIGLTRRHVNSEAEFTITLPESLGPLYLEVYLPETLPHNYLKVDGSNSSRLLHFNGHFSSLKELILGSFTSIPESLGNFSVLEKLKLEKCAQLKRLPQSFGNLSSLKELDMSNCSMLDILPESFGNLSSLERLFLRGCSKLEKLPDTFGNLSSLTLLDMGNCSMLAMLPDSFGNLSSLRKLFLPGCSKLEELPDTFGSLSSLGRLNLTHCPVLSRYTDNLKILVERGAVYVEQ